MAKEKKNSLPPPGKEKPKKPVKEAKARKEKPPKKWDADRRVMEAFRTCILVFLVAVVAISIWNALKGDQTPQLSAEIRDTAAEMRTSIIIHTEATAFAQDFIKTYLTYQARGVDDYRKRLEQYCPPRLAGDITENLLLKEEANAVYVQAINVSGYGHNQYDITVMAEVAYTRKPEPVMDRITGLFTTAQAVTTKNTLYFIVPLYSDGNGRYVIEDIPRVTAPPNTISYSYQDYAGTYADEASKAAAQQMLNDFFKTLYTEPQNKIDYYLAEDADKSKFQELRLNGSMDFVRIENLSLYNTAAANEFMGIVSIKISDTNGTEVRQRFNILLQKRDKFYAKDINLRTYNLKS